MSTTRSHGNCFLKIRKKNHTHKNLIWMFTNFLSNVGNRAKGPMSRFELLQCCVDRAGAAREQRLLTTFTTQTEFNTFQQHCTFHEELEKVWEWGWQSPSHTLRVATQKLMPTTHVV